MLQEITDNFSSDYVSWYNQIDNGFATIKQLFPSTVSDATISTAEAVSNGNFKGYVLTDKDISNLKELPVEKYTPDSGDAYIVLTGQPATVTKQITVYNAEGTAVDETPRQVTGVEDYTNQFVLDNSIFNRENDKLIDEDGNQVDIVSQAIIIDPSQKVNGFAVTLDDTKTANYTIIPNNYGTALIHYQKADGTQARPDQLIYGETDTTQKVTSPTVSGYTPDQATTEVTFGTERKELTVTYTPTPTNTGNNTDAGTTTTPDQVTKPFKPFMIYAKRALYQYPSATFKASQRQQFHRHQPRIKADTFKVVGTAKSTAGRLRYYLSDGSYVTANPDYVANLYWQGQSYQRIKVTNPRGTYQYKQTTFKRANRQTYLKKGTVVKVTQVIHKGYMTRYELANGQYITGNKQWVTPLA